jgi:LuxR family maltose regulon positive regulatory protein
VAERLAQYPQSSFKFDLGLHFNEVFKNIETLLRVRLLLATGHPDQALHLLEPLLVSVRADERDSQIIEILILQALAYQAKQANSTALALLKEALSLAEPEGYMRVILDEAPAINSLLQRVAQLPATEQPVSPAYLQKLLAAAQLTPVPTSTLTFPVTALIEPLTGRELAVLRLLDTSLSTPEIGRELVVAASTVRTHVKNIYAKLGVQNRHQAIERARELGLL